MDRAGSADRLQRHHARIRHPRRRPRRRQRRSPTRSRSTEPSPTGRPTDMVMTPGNTVAGYQVYGALLNDATLGKTYVIGIDATSATDPVIGAGTTIYLNTDQNTATGYSPFGNIGAEYEVVFAYGSNSQLEPFLYSSDLHRRADAAQRRRPAELRHVQQRRERRTRDPAVAADAGRRNRADLDQFRRPGQQRAGPAGRSRQRSRIYDRRSRRRWSRSITPSRRSPSSIPQPPRRCSTAAARPAKAPTPICSWRPSNRRGRRASPTTSCPNPISPTSPSSSQYSALIFPSFQDVPSAQVSAISSALAAGGLRIPRADHHVRRLHDERRERQSAVGQFLRQHAEPAQPDPPHAGYGTATYSVTPDAAALASNNPILAGYTAGELIGGASGEFAGTTQGSTPAPAIWPSRATRRLPPRSPTSTSRGRLQRRRRRRRRPPAARTPFSRPPACSATATCSSTSSRTPCSARRRAFRSTSRGSRAS